MSVSIRIRNGMTRTDGEGGASEGDIRGNWSDAIDSVGVVDLAGGHLLVHEASVPGMSAVVDAGIGYIPNDSFDQTDSDSIKFWEAVVAGTVGSRTLVIGANSSGSTRIDLVCLKIDPGETSDPNASNVAVLIVVPGTPGAGVPMTPAFHLKLAEVSVVNGATEIEDNDITDRREQITLKSVLAGGKRITTIASSATPTPNGDGSTTDVLEITALSANAVFDEPTGTPADGKGIIIRVKDNGTSRTLGYNAVYRAIGCVLPVATVPNKTIYYAVIANVADSKFDIVAVQMES